MTEATCLAKEETLHPTALGSTVSENSIRFLGHDDHAHEEPHLVYVVRGSAVLIVDGDELPLRTGESAWLQPLVPHSMRIREGGMVLGPMLEPHVAPASRVQALGAVPAIADVMSAAMVAAPRTSAQVVPFRRALGRVLETLSRPYFPAVYPEHPAARRLARDAVRLPVSLDELAHQHRMSARQVQRIFLAETGLPFSRWRGRMRLNAAIAHLAGGGDASAAARLAGFRTRAGLLKALNRETGISLEQLSRDPSGALHRD